MLVDRVETFRAYRDTLRRRFDQATHAALEEVPPGEWDGMQVIRRKVLEEIIHDFASADPDPLPTSAEVRTPARLFVDAVCPICSIPARVLVEVHAELVVDEDGRTIKAKASTKGSNHVCGQLPLETDDSEQLSLSDIATEPTLVLVTTAPKPDDVSLGTPEDDRCGAEATIPDPEGGDEEMTLVCERRVDHDAVSLMGARDHWAEGGYAWHYAELAVATSEARLESEEGDDAPE